MTATLFQRTLSCCAVLAVFSCAESEQPRIIDDPAPTKRERTAPARAAVDSGSPERDAATEEPQDTGPARSAAATTRPSATTPPSAATPIDASTAPTCAPIDKLDLLLMIDNSNSMAAEQVSLKNAFPGLIEALTTGKRSPNDPAPFPAITDVHVGVVSSDMGIPGVEFPPSCRADGGDDGVLRNIPSGDICDAMYPAWLSFNASAQTVPADITKLANDMRCIASLGTGGCGIEQQLESPLKALWPKRYRDRAGKEVENPIRFLSTVEPGTWGRGDVPLAERGNLGFLRAASDPSPSLLVIVAVTDEDDCSVSNTSHLKPNNQLPEDNPLRREDINLRCFLHKEFLYDVQKRYYEGFRALRQGHEDRVMFAAIAGIPVDLVSPDALTNVDFSATDPASRTAFYDAVLADSRMQETIDPTTMPGSGLGNLTKSCERPAPGEPFPSSAYPPRRIVELAKLFDRNGMIQSICQDDFTGPTQQIVNMIARRLESQCN